MYEQGTIPNPDSTLLLKLILRMPVSDSKDIVIMLQSPFSIRTQSISTLILQAPFSPMHQALSSSTRLDPKLTRRTFSLDESRGFVQTTGSLLSDQMHGTGSKRMLDQSVRYWKRLSLISLPTPSRSLPQCCIRRLRVSTAS